MKKVPRFFPIKEWSAQTFVALYRVLTNIVDVVNNQISVVRVTNATYVVTPSDDVIFANTDDNTITIKIQAGSQNRALRIINCGSSTNDVTITPNGSETIRGAASATLADGEQITLHFDKIEYWW